MISVKEQKGPGPAVAKDATPHPRSQPGPPLPWETIAFSTIATVMCGERQVVGTEGTAVPQPASLASRGFWEIPGRDVSAPWLCPYSVRLSQSLIFSLRVCHFALPDYFIATLLIFVYA